MHPIKLKNEMGDSAIKSEYVFAQFVDDILLLMIMIIKIRRRGDTRYIKYLKKNVKKF
jgi:hypothetical protein